LPKPTKKRKNVRKIQPATQPPCSGVKYIIPVASATLSGGQDENSPPADAIAHPAPKKGARNRAETGGD